MVLIEAARYLGFGARFVSGYLYDPDLDKGDATQAVAATHAWAETICRVPAGSNTTRPTS
jgi:transglutaminase-like putative cysteine protease